MRGDLLSPSPIFFFSFQLFVPPALLSGTHILNDTAHRPQQRASKRIDIAACTASGTVEERESGHCSFAFPGLSLGLSLPLRLRLRHVGPPSPNAARGVHSCAREHRPGEHQRAAEHQRSQRRCSQQPAPPRGAQQPRRSRSRSRREQQQQQRRLGLRRSAARVECVAVGGRGVGGGRRAQLRPDMPGDGARRAGGAARRVPRAPQAVRIPGGQCAQSDGARVLPHSKRKRQIRSERISVSAQSVSIVSTRTTWRGATSLLSSLTSLLRILSLSVCLRVLISFFSNYRRWCHHINAQRWCFQKRIKHAFDSPSYGDRNKIQDLVLWLLIWGEASNLRHV